MAFGTTRDRTATHTRHRMSPILMATSLLIWVSSVIVMGITAWIVSQNNGTAANRVIYILVISVLTTALFLASFFLTGRTGFFLLFNLIFSYLWLVAVVFTAEGWSNSGNKYLLTVEAFSFIAFFLLLFNVLYDWHIGYRGRRTGAVV
ncbi:hypothetical protein QBC39DRAFT_365575 [Podospora conica]|nr:hypothetical protein QBC39DRAFT_365575 [Schizothecium conicum]